MEEFKAGLLARETAQTVEMTTAWFEVERSLTGSINLLVKEIDTLQKAGETVTRGKIVKLDRYRELLAQARVETLKYSNDFATPFVTVGQEQVAKLGLSNAAEAVEISFATRAKIGPMFNRLNFDAVEFMVGNTGAGGPVGDLLKERVVTGPDVMMRVTNTLVDGTARGIGPRRIAGLIANDLAGGLNKALQIARTEQLRVYRESSRIQYTDSGVVSGYKRLSARDDRVCPACLMADGEIFRLEISFAEHVQGRCTLVPIVIGADTPQWETGKEWFEKQPPEVQARILGPGRFEAWKNGEFELDALVTKKTSSVWGDALVPTPLKDLISVPTPPKDLVKTPPRTEPAKIADIKPLSEERAETLYGETYDDFLHKDIPDEKLISIEKYSGGDFEFTNEIARDGKLGPELEKKAAGINVTEADIKETTANIQNVIDQSPGLQEDTLLWRGVDSEELLANFKDGTYQVGDVMSDPAFTSTTLNQEVVSEFSGGKVEFKIIAPEGTKGIYMESATLIPGEQEFLLGQNTEMKIADILENPDGSTTVTVTMELEDG